MSELIKNEINIDFIKAYTGFLKLQRMITQVNNPAVFEEKGQVALSKINGDFIRFIRLCNTYYITLELDIGFARDLLEYLQDTDIQIASTIAKR